MIQDDVPGAEDDGTRDIEPAPNRVVRVLQICVAVTLFAMAAITFVDVIGRYFFSAPIPGTFEIVGFLLGISMFLAFPMVTLQEKHITVDLFDGFFKGPIRRVRYILILIVTALMAAFMGERLWAAAADEWASDYVTQYFGITRAPLLILMSCLCFGTAVAMLFLIWRRLRSRHNDSSGASEC